MKNKFSFIFPGQGSQTVGMGKELVENFIIARDIFNQANSMLDFDLEQVCFQGPEAKLNNTKYTQPAIYTVSYIIHQILINNNIKPDIVAGHSLGEYSALAAAEAFKFKDGLELVSKRGKLMAAASKEKGTMAAILGLQVEKINSIYEQIPGILETANYNTPSQIVISGQKEAVLEGMELAEELGAKKTVELNVSGAFHSSLMAPVQEDLRSTIEKIKINDPKTPVVLNVSAKAVTKKAEIKKELLLQLTNSVNWVDSVNLMIDRGINDFIEVGPGRVLKGLMRRIDRSVNCSTTNNIKQINKLINNE